MATLEADGKRLSLENDKRRVLGDDQTNTMGRKADVGAANKGADAAGTAETNAVGRVGALQEDDLASTQSHHIYRSRSNPYAPSLPKDENKRKP